MSVGRIVPRLLAGVAVVLVLAVAAGLITSPALANGAPQSLAVVDALVQRTRKG